MTVTFTPGMILADWARLKLGRLVVVSDAWHDAAIEYFKQNEGPEADIFFRDLATAPNPRRVGTLDGYIASLVGFRSLCNQFLGCDHDHDADEKHFVSVRNEAGNTRLLLGPYDWHFQSLGNVGRGRSLAETHDARACWYSYGTCSMKSAAAAACESKVIFKGHTWGDPEPEKPKSSKGRGKTVAHYRH